MIGVLYLITLIAGAAGLVLWPWIERPLAALRARQACRRHQEMFAAFEAQFDGSVS